MPFKNFFFFAKSGNPRSWGCCYPEKIEVLKSASKKGGWLLGRHMPITTTETYKFLQKEKIFFPDTDTGKIYPTDFSRRETE